MSSGPHSHPNRTGNAAVDASNPTAAAPAQLPRTRMSPWLVFKTALARLRFFGILVAVGGVIVYWDTFKAHYEKWTRPLRGQVAISSDLEFWCPMHPTIVRETPDKCPICGMPLSKRKKGEAGEEEPLPPGVVSRVQLSPYRVALAGIKTAPVEYRRLNKEIRTVGFVEYDERRLTRITARISGKSRIDKLFVNVTGQLIEKDDPLAMLYSPDLVVTVQNLIDARRSGSQDLVRLARERLVLWGIPEKQIEHFLDSDKAVTHFVVRSPSRGYVLRKYQVEGDYVEEGARLYDVAELSTVWIEAQVFEEDLGFLQIGQSVEATTPAYPGRVFHGKLSFIYPQLDSSTRTLKVRFDIENPDLELKPKMYANISLHVPLGGMKAFARQLETERIASSGIDALQEALGGYMALGAVARLGTANMVAGRFMHLHRGDVLAVPENAVIDTGTRKIVYREVEPGLYEGVEINCGPRGDGYYSVLSGLELGEMVATSGSFLIDAETRLTSGMGSTYFGASGGPQDSSAGTGGARPSMSEDLDAKLLANLAKLSPEDQKLAKEQAYCAVLKNSPLGSMGTPIKLLIDGQPVFICCKGCRSDAFDDPQKTLAQVQHLRNRQQAVPAPEKSPGNDVAEQAIREFLSELPDSDRKAAESQKFCVVATHNRLGSMGVPVKLEVEGQTVFICCESCAEEVREHPQEAIEKSRMLKSKNAQGR